MSPRLGITANLSNSSRKVDYVPAVPIDTPGVLAGVSISANNANTIISTLTVQNTSTGGKLLKASLENGKTTNGNELMNGTGTLTVTRDPGGDTEATSTATCYIYFSTTPNQSTTSYFIAPTENSNGLVYGDATEFDLATDFAEDIGIPQGDFKFVTATLQIGAFAFSVVVDGVLRTCTTSNTAASSSIFVLGPPA